MASRYDFIETVTNPAINNKEIKGFITKDFIKKFLDGRESVSNIQHGFQYRPDKLAAYYYNNPTYYWILTYVNNFENGIEDYVLGKEIIVPHPDTVRSILEG